MLMYLFLDHLLCQALCLALGMTEKHVLVSVLKPTVQWRADSGGPWLGLGKCDSWNGKGAESV